MNHEATDYSQNTMQTQIEMLRGYIGKLHTIIDDLTKRVTSLEDSLEIMGWDKVLEIWTPYMLKWTTVPKP